MRALWSKYLAIQDWKASNGALLDGVNYANVVATSLYQSGGRSQLRRAVYALFYSWRIVSGSKSGEVLVFYSHRDKHRRDYDYIVDYLIEAAEDRGALVELHDHFSPIQPFRTLGFWPSGWRATRTLHLDALERLTTSLLIARYRSARSALGQHIVGHDIVATFSDALPWDNLVAQLAGLAGLPSITAQHGQYRLLDETNVSADAEAYANFVSDVMLVWGPATVDQLTKAGIARVRLVTSGWIREQPRIEQANEGNRPSTFGVVLNGQNGDAGNYMLIRVAERLASDLDMKYIVRAHPTFGARDYARVAHHCAEIRPMPLADYAGRVSFSLAHASSSTLELLLAGEVIYVVDDGTVADVFRHPGLTYSEEEILGQVRLDLDSPIEARTRLDGLKLWFNDDRDQASAVRHALRRRAGRPDRGIDAWGS